jgi:hypothetical protein
VIGFVPFSRDRFSPCDEQMFAEIWHERIDGMRHPIAESSPVKGKAFQTLEFFKR